MSAKRGVDPRVSSGEGPTGTPAGDVAATTGDDLCIRAEVRSPVDLTRSEWIGVLTSVKDQIKRDEVSSLAAGAAFRFFLSLFPVLIATVAIFGVIADPARLETYVRRAANVVPDAALGLVEQQLAAVIRAEPGGVGVAVLGIGGGLIAAVAASRAIVVALNRAYGLEESRSFVRQRLIALVLMAALLVALLGLVALLVFGPQIVEWLFPETLLRGGLRAVATVVRYAAAILLLITLFGFVYAFGPDRPAPRWRWLSPGAVLAVAGWLAVSYGFAVYTRLSSVYERAAYEGLGGVIVLLLWLQLTMLILLAGAELNAAVERICE